MAPPQYSKISKSADGLFNDDFGASSNKFTLKSKTANGVDLKIEASRSTGPISGLIETSWTTKNGWKVSEKWTTKNVVTTEVGFNDSLLQNSDVTLSADITPTTHMMNNWTVKSKYNVDKVATNLDIAPKSVGFSSVFSWKNYLFGFKASSPLDFSEFKASVAGSYTTGGLVIATTVADSGDVQGSVFNKCCDNFSAGAKFGWARGNGAVNFGVAGEYKVDENTTLKAKTDENFNLNFSIIQQVSKNVSARVSADIPSNKESSLGFNLTIDA